MSSIAHRLNERIFIEVLLFADLRRELLAVVAGRSAEAHSTLALVGVVAPKCHATPDELRRAIHLLEAEICTEADDVLLELLHHPEAPEDELVRLAEAGRFLPVLGHRSGPLRLLETIADKHRFPAAITTLALRYYGATGAPANAFRDFLRRFADVPMLEEALRQAPHLDDAKRAIVREVFG